MTDDHGPDARIGHDTGGDDWLRGEDDNRPLTVDEPWLPQAAMDPEYLIADSLSKVYRRAFTNLAETGVEDDDFPDNAAHAAAEQIVRSFAMMVSAPQAPEPPPRFDELTPHAYGGGIAWSVTLPAPHGRLILEPTERAHELRVTWFVEIKGRMQQVPVILGV